MALSAALLRDLLGLDLGGDLVRERAAMLNNTLTPENFASHFELVVLHHLVPVWLSLD